MIVSWITRHLDIGPLWGRPSTLNVQFADASVVADWTTGGR
jgi:hypothetical protein